MGENGRRRRFNGAVRARVAIEVLREQKTAAAQIASEFECHTSQVARWKKEALEGLPTLFATRVGERAEERLSASLYEQIGRLKMELEWFKKKFGASA